jgi:hypothetical protein
VFIGAIPGPLPFLTPQRFNDFKAAEPTFRVDTDGKLGTVVKRSFNLPRNGDIGSKRVSYL